MMIYLFFQDGYEDVEIGNCMQGLGIKPGNSRDPQVGPSSQATPGILR